MEYQVKIRHRCDWNSFHCESQFVTVSKKMVRPYFTNNIETSFWAYF